MKTQKPKAPANSTSSRGNAKNTAADLQKTLEEINSQLNDLEERYYGLFELNNDAIFLIDLKGNYIDLNQRAAAMLGYRKEELIGQSAFRFITQGEIKAGKKILKRLKKGEQVPVYERVFLRKDGSHFPAEINVACVFDEQGKPKYIQSIIRDISNRKKLEKELKQSERSFRLAFEYAKEAILWADPKTGIIINCNKAATKLLKKAEEELIDSSISSIHPPEKADYYLQRFQNTSERGVGDAEGEIITKTGEIIPVIISSSRIFVKGKMVIQGIFRDITEQKKAESLLSFRLDFEVVVSRILRLFVDSPLTELENTINKALEHLGRFTEAGHCFALFLSGDKSHYEIRYYWNGNHEEPLLANLKKYPFYYFEKKIKEKLTIIVRNLDDLPSEAVEERKWFENNGFRPLLLVPIVLEKQVYGAIGIFGALNQPKEWKGEINILLKFIGSIIINYLKRMKAAEALRESEEKYRSIFTEARDGIVLINCKTRKIFDANQEFQLQTGLTLKELRKMKIWELTPPNEQKITQELFLTIFNNGQGVFEIKFQDKEGKISSIAISAQKITLRNQEYIQLLCRDITAQKEAEIQIRKSESRYRTLFEDSAISLWEEDFSQVKEYFEKLRQKGITNFRQYFVDHPEEVNNCSQLIKIRDVNKETLRLFEAKTKAELLGSLDRIFSKESYETFQEELIALAEGKTEFEGEVINRTISGKELTLYLRLNVPEGYEQSLRRVYLSIMDITKLKQIETALKQSKERLDLAVKSAELGVWDWNIQTNQIIFNERWAEMLGYSLKEIEPHISSWKNLVHPDDRPKVNKLLNDHLAGKTSIYQANYRLLTKSKEWKWIFAIGKVVEWDEKGKPLRATGMHLDVNEEKRIEKELRIRDFAIRSSINAIAFVGLDGKITYVNTSFLELWGYEDSKEVLGKPAISFWQSEEEAQQVIDTLFEKTFWTGELASKKKDGTSLILQLSANLVKDNEGSPLMMMSSFIDITEQKKIEEQIRMNERRFQLLITKMNDAVSILENNKPIFLSDRLVEILGYSKEELMKMTAIDFCSPEEKARIQKIRDEAFQTGKVPKELKYWAITKNGERKYLRNRYSTFTIDGKLVMQFILTTDITKQKEIEEKLHKQRAELQKQRDELESFASTVSHDIKGQLQIIAMYNQLQNTTYTQEISDEIERISSLLENSLLLASEGKIIDQITQVDMMDLSKKISKRIKALAPDLEIEIKQLPEIKGDIQRINQVLENLLMNIVKHAKASKVQIFAKETDKEYRIFIQDNGKGLSKEIQQKIVNSWKTKKYTTFGLLIVYKIMKGHNGKVSFESSKGKGTTFILHFPKK
ncbi:MAG: PAS domain S-box protein [Candidatus Heimdallarchaeota archaeon]|nr:PAS domain S-box protein [Candidatus Heimdallarchaeota archaeon]